MINDDRGISGDDNNNDNGDIVTNNNKSNDNNNNEGTMINNCGCNRNNHINNYSDNMCLSLTII